MKSRKKYAAVIDNKLIEEEYIGDLNCFVDSIMIKGRIFLIDEFHDYLRNVKGMSLISSSACISRIKRIDSCLLSELKPIDLILYFPFILSTSQEIAKESLEKIKYYIAHEMVSRSITQVSVLPNRQYSDCKSAFGKYANFMDNEINTDYQKISNFQYGDLYKRIPHLSSQGLTLLKSQLKTMSKSL